MTDPKPRRIRKRHVAGGSLIGLAVLAMTQWASVAPSVCPVLPERAAKALCAPHLITQPDGGAP